MAGEIERVMTEFFERFFGFSQAFMPELPEVQTVVTDLNEKIRGDEIVDFWSDTPGAIKNATLKNFQKEIKGRKILLARRIGKNIFIDLSGGKTLYIHLKMTGHLLVKRKAQNAKRKNAEEDDYFSDKVNQYIRHIWKLKVRNTQHATRNTGVQYDKTLEFSDLRKFGKIAFLDTDKINELKEIKALGVDAMSSDFSLEKFKNILEKKQKSPIGVVLMEQNLIAGIGNIYRSEILFEAGVLPERKVASLSQKEIKNIYSNIKKVLKKAIRLRGTSDSDYRDTAGAPGGFQKVMKVYNQERKKCPKCGTIIERKKLGQRSVFLCHLCQK